MDEEVEYVGCLLVTGPPELMDNRRGWDHSTPVSSIGYMYRCYNWYNANVRETPVATKHGVFPREKDFNDWWVRYKIWMVSTRT